MKKGDCDLVGLIAVILLFGGVIAALVYSLFLAHPPVSLQYLAQKLCGGNSYAITWSSSYPVVSYSVYCVRGDVVLKEYTCKEVADNAWDCKPKE